MLTRKTLLGATFALLLVGEGALSITARAENIVLPIASQGLYLGDIKHPDRGQKQSFIISEYGEPLTKSLPIGSPPISHWDYPDFSVYFENNTVIRTVLQHRRLDRDQHQAADNASAPL